MTDDDTTETPEVPVVCPECGSTSRVPLSEAAATIDRHNERLHDGADVAQVDPEVADHLVDMVAEDLDLL